MFLTINCSPLEDAIVICTNQKFLLVLSISNQHYITFITFVAWTRIITIKYFDFLCIKDNGYKLKDKCSNRFGKIICRI